MEFNTWFFFTKTKDKKRIEFKLSLNIYILCSYVIAKLNIHSFIHENNHIFNDSVSNYDLFKMNKVNFSII